MNFLQIFDYGLNSVVASGPLHPTRAVADRPTAAYWKSRGRRCRIGVSVSAAEKAGIDDRACSDVTRRASH